MSEQGGSFAELLRSAVGTGASDVHITAGSPVRIRLKGQIVNLGQEPLTHQQTMAIALHILFQAGRIAPDTAPEIFARELTDEDCAYSVNGVGRFRVNICKQRGSAAVVLRVIATDVPTVEQLGLPDVIREISMEERGLILVTGATGSGKSTTLAAMIDLLNASRACKIVTIEDPIEFMYRDKKASIMQREVGNDTHTFSSAMRAALRQDPDVILVGEMRDRDTVDIALKAAETGHLVLSTVHTPDAPKSINRLISYCDVAEQTMLRLRLADTIKAIISQRLLPRKDGTGRIPAIEVMRATVSVKDCIADPEKTGSIIDFIKSGRDQYKMQTFDQHLMELYEQGMIDLDVAKAAASSPADFERNLVFV